MMHIHILGIGGTFMSGLAQLAKACGFKVTGCDANCYPPISDLLKAQQIDWVEGYEETSLALKADLVIVGNAAKRGMPVLEAILNAKKPYVSGPQWLAENILKDKRVLAISGTHGKTTTTTMAVSILEHAGLKPSFLIGGVAPEFGTNARLGEGNWFVIEADEYDSAFFDKRPKFMHYRPEIAVINNLEFDHADIYPNLQAIQTQFHYFLRTIPQEGLLLAPKHVKAVDEVLHRGVFSALESIAVDRSADWQARIEDKVGQVFHVVHKDQKVAQVEWNLMGQFNVENALAALAACHQAGVAPQVSADVLSTFQSPKRRLELKYQNHGVTLYDDFAHHPTAIQNTLQALKDSGKYKRVLAVLEFGSYTMRKGVHADKMAQALGAAEKAFILSPSDFDIQPYTNTWQFPYTISSDKDELTRTVGQSLQAGDAVVVMSNKGMEAVHQKLIQSIDRN